MWKIAYDARGRWRDIHKHTNHQRYRARSSSAMPARTTSIRSLRRKRRKQPVGNLSWSGSIQSCHFPP